MNHTDRGHRLSRRSFLRGAAATSAALSMGDAVLGRAVARATRAAPSAAVLGGGPGGLTVAHELAERGFAVTVIERKALGGKARSIPVPNSGTGGRRDLPGEHGFRFFPGFYQNLPDTMGRIPVSGNANGVIDNLTVASEGLLSRSGGREDLRAPFGPEAGPTYLTPEVLVSDLTAGFQTLGEVPPHELAFFVRQLLVYLTSSEERRYGQWEYVSWWDFVRAEQMSAGYQQLLARALTRALVAAKEDVASTRTIGKMAEAFIYNAMRRSGNSAPDRLLDAPTNEAWIDPWVAHLRSLRVRFVSGTVEGLHLRDRRIHGATVRTADGQRQRVSADYFVCAMPVERARQLWTPDIASLDPRLAGSDELQTDWMNGLQFYLSLPVPVAHGHVAYMDSPWALTSVSQAQFWTERDLARDYGDGTVRECLSVDISDWSTPGMLYGRPARECTPDEIAREVWVQIKASLEDTGEELLPDDLLRSWFLDPAITYPDPSRVAAANDEPLLINSVGSWDSRPDAATGVENLFLAADYVRTDIDLATMEGANEAGRRAVNGVLDAAGSARERTAVYTLYQPPEFETLKQLDAQRFRNGQPNLFDTAWPDINGTVDDLLSTVRRLG